ncbi:MAG TPA: 5-methyltetrahydropteroyltriglutamate--homocysteine S-methyltransferase [Dehalococcoidia bacterium]|nr:5-methyltetrahydropteroyltriglutamate--homocysteine S-methyltransferase [Dehalococcoidia bacterium]
MSNKYRADQVGSFLRPPEVIEAHQKQRNGEITLEQLRALEDEAILKVLDMQRQVGIDVLSDGEYRRTSWASDFTEKVEGYVPGRPLVQMRFSNPIPPPSAGGPGNPGGPRVFGAPLKLKGRLTGEESAFLKAHAGGMPYKITMPAPSYITARGYSPAESDAAFGSRKGLLMEVAKIIQQEVKALVAEGVPYIQLDNPHYPDYFVEERREAMRAAGNDPDQALLDDIEADNLALTGFDRSNVTLGMHLCRGNGAMGGWHTEGGYDPIAEPLFNRLNVDRFLLEYDSARAGGFGPLRFMPRGKIAVLGLVTTKSGQLETAEDLTRRIEEAARQMAMEDIALSPQCGFASVMQGNPLTWDEQRQKLELVVSVARNLWTD